MYENFRHELINLVGECEEIFSENDYLRLNSEIMFIEDKLKVAKSYLQESTLAFIKEKGISHIQISPEEKVIPSYKKYNRFQKEEILKTLNCPPELADCLVSQPFNKTPICKNEKVAGFWHEEIKDCITLKKIKPEIIKMKKGA